MIGDQLKKQLTELSPDSQEPTITNLFEDVELNEVEIEEALRAGREKKFYELRQKEYWNKIAAGETWKKPNARELYDRLLQTRSQTGDRFQLTDWNKSVIHNLCLYFAGDAKFETMGEGFSLQKGIMLTGKPGTGKSHLMSFFTKNPHASFAHVTCKAVAERYRTGWKRDELDTLEWYSFNAKADFGHVYGQTELGYCFGDLGTEGEKKNFGNAMNVMEHIIFQRYENKLDYNMTHFTTNLDAKDIEQYYGERVRDRLREMCNRFALIGPSFR